MARRVMSPLIPHQLLIAVHADLFELAGIKHKPSASSDQSDADELAKFDAFCHSVTPMNGDETMQLRESVFF